MKAYGVHVFAGGFTMGVQEVCPVTAQFEIHDFGRATVEKRLKIPFVNEGSWDGWLTHKSLYENCDFCFGNPRCTGFSTLTSGYDDTIHGPFAKCTQDIWDLCEFGVRAKTPLVIWESVQQAYTVGRPLLTQLAHQVFEPRGYRVAHVFINAASHGNAQRRKRYFFVGYKADRNFNIVPPLLPERRATVRDKIGSMMDLETHQSKLFAGSADYDADSYNVQGPWISDHIQFLGPGMSKNGLPWDTDVELQRACPVDYEKWLRRLSDIPFSLHSTLRLIWDSHCPTISSAAHAFVHPELHRTLTVREISALMGWPKKITPAGTNPIGQIAKGVCPEVGRWLAEQAQLYHDDVWGMEDWSTQYDPKLGDWVGEDYTNAAEKPLEKVLHTNDYEPEAEECDTAV